MFFVTDKIQSGDEKIAFCPTHDMLADFFTKPNENAVEKRYGEKQRLSQGRKQDSYNNQSTWEH